MHMKVVTVISCFIKHEIIHRLYSTRLLLLLPDNSHRIPSSPLIILLDDIMDDRGEVPLILLLH